MKTKQAAKHTPGPRTHVLRREDFTQYALDLGVWDGLCEDHGVSSNAREITITITAVRRDA